MAKNLASSPILAKIWPKKFFSWVLPLLDIIHCCKRSLCAISRKTNKPNLRKWQKILNLGPILAQIWSPKIFLVDFTSDGLLDFVASYHCMQFQGKLINQIWENGRKPSFGPNFGPKFGLLNFLSKIWLRQSLDVMVSYHHIQYQKKLMIQSWENLVTDRQTDGQTDGQTEGWERFHRTLSD